MVVTVFGATVNYVLIFRPSFNVAMDAQRCGLKIGMDSGCVMTVVTLAYCGTMINILHRRRLKEAFRADKDLMRLGDEDSPYVRTEMGDRRW